ncbi:MAG: sensor histidine kinase [Acidimicrobiales bacterium]
MTSAARLDPLDARLARRPISVAGAIGVFALSGLLVLMLLGVSTVIVLGRLGTQEAIRDAKTNTGTVTRAVVWPNLSDDLVTGDPAAVDRLDDLLKRTVLSDKIIRAKIWTPDGLVVYSDQRELIGQLVAVDDEMVVAYNERRTVAGVSDLDKSENEYERGLGRILEVYSPVRTPSGDVLLFELCFKYSSILDNGRMVLKQILPLLLGALLALQALQVPLAWRLARRLRDGHLERERLLARAVESSEAERRRIAADLHDGIVQDMVGLSLGLKAAADAASRSPAPDPAAVALLGNAAAGARRGVRQLRSLLVDLYPPSLHSAGLQSALSDLLAPFGARGVEARLECTEVEAGPAAEALVYRVAQESLRNVLAHSDAHRVLVQVAQRNGHVELVVRDDGIGFDPGTAADAAGNGHFGLRLLGDLAREAGGTLEVSSAPGHGTLVRLEAPR